MKLQGNITLLINQDGMRIEVRDTNSRTIFLKIELSVEETVMALSRVAERPCEMEVSHLDRIGKTQEMKRNFEFEVSPEIRFGINKDNELQKMAQELCDTMYPNEGWIADGYFRSQDSFFSKDGKHYARCTIRRWI